MATPVGIFVGRFCPIHYGHMKIINEMINRFGISNVLVLIGSSNSPISWRILFTYLDRRRWLKRLYPSLKLCGLPDIPNNDSVWFQMLDDYIDIAFKRYNPSNIIFYGGSIDDIKFFYDNGREIEIFNRYDQNISGTLIRQLLLQNESIDKFVDPRISSEVCSVFHKRLKMLDELRNTQ